MTTTATLQATSIAPSLTVNDLQKSLAFYQGLGFTIEHPWEHDGVMRGAMLQAGSARLGIGQDDWAKGKNRVKGTGLRIWLNTDQDVDEIAASAKAAGVKLDAEPADFEWGGRGFAVTDPDGFMLTIAKGM